MFVGPADTFLFGTFGGVLAARRYDRLIIPKPGARVVFVDAFRIAVFANADVAVIIPIVVGFAARCFCAFEWKVPTDC